ncbi:pentapeptide repeat-containing protein [Streptomyces sp. NPDC001552]|uniref:pentapeptide repeat-containing protein n=1 Tax=Streptomyces sp. NPDC001552 TaxID=3364587 RepID=UPI00368870C0
MLAPEAAGSNTIGANRGRLHQVSHLVQTFAEVAQKGRPGCHGVMRRHACWVLTLAGLCVAGGLAWAVLGPLTNTLVADMPESSDAGKQAVTITGTRQALLLATSGAVATVTLVFAALTYYLNRRSHHLDRYDKARTQLHDSNKSSDQLDAIYALSRCLREIPTERDRILQLMGNFLRGLLQDVPRERTGGQNVDPPNDVAIATLLAIGAQPRSRNLYALHLKQKQLRGVDLRKARLPRANFRGSWLGEARMDEAKLRRASLEGAWVQSANLYRANLRESNMKDIWLAGAYLMQAKLQNARLIYAHMEEALLIGANLKNARMSGSNLVRANLSSARLQGATLDGVILTDANLRKANLKNTRGLTADSLLVAKIYNSTKLDKPLADNAEVKSRIRECEGGAKRTHGLAEMLKTWRNK